MDLSDKQKKCLKFFYNTFSMSLMCGEPFSMPYDKRTANSLVHRGLLHKTHSDYSEKYIGYIITEKGISLAKDLFGLRMNKTWDNPKGHIMDMGYSLSRMRDNHVDNFSDELPWKQVARANRLMFSHKEVIENNFWLRRN